ncbi:hypothetical protein JCM10908_005652 [Rhodotorula pacifica]|uniref:uncharacterized protein n=1 Tax=Rhodotorula pacifica TaxID=1495444 RepID=UPI0031828C10
MQSKRVMSVFSSKARKAQEAVAGLDATSVLRSAGAWQLGQLGTLGIGSDLTAIAYDPVQSLLAVGTEHGRLFVFGKPGVQLSWDLGYPSKIRHLAFRSGSGFLCAVDAKDTLYVFDLQRLDSHGRPTRDSSTSLRTNVTCIEASASHAFLLIGGKDGTVDVYDLDRGIIAPHARIPNLWLAQEELLRRSGVPDAPSRRHIPVCTDVKTHPLNLNLVLIAYEGGVSLWNLATKESERTWEFVLPPGAPGGGNDTEETLFAERRPAVTCLAWRPDGLLFVAGHEDGTISFAAMDDDNPVMLRTIERADVNKATEEDLFGWSAPGQGGQRQPANREPIFRLAWSGFPQETYLAKAFASTTMAGSSASAVPASPSVIEDKTDLNGGTVLTILGGLRPSDPVGVHVFSFPAYVPPPAATAKTGNMPVAVREALRASITPTAHHHYPTPSAAEDFLLLPRSSPHYGGTYDPASIIITSGRDERCPVLPAPHSALNVEAYTFPPSLTRAFRRLHLPAALSFSGNATCSTASPQRVPPSSYRQICHQFDLAEETAERIPITGGRAFPKPRPTRRGPPPTSGDQGPRLLVTSHVDLSVRLWDISTRVLWGEKPEDGGNPYIDEDFPRPLRHLDVDVRSLLSDPRVQDTLAAQLLRERPWELEIARVSLAEETLELAITLSTGDVLIYRFAYGEHPADIEVDRIEAEADLDGTVQGALRDMSLGPDRLPPPGFPYNNPTQTPTASHSAKHRLGSLAHHGSSRRSSHVAEAPSLDPQDLYIDVTGAVVPRPDFDGFRPIAVYRSPTQDLLTRSCLSMSNIGFLASSNGATLLIIDLRGPEVIFFEMAGTATSATGKGKSRPDSSPIVSLTWTICAIGEDHDRSPRLLVTQESGLTRVFEVASVGGTWHVGSQPVSVPHESARGAVASFVIDKTGDELLADAQRLQLSQAYQGQAFDAAGGPASLWIVVTRTSAACYFKIDGPKVAEYVDERECFEKATIVHQQGCAALVVQSRSCAMYTFSLPALQQVSRMKFETTLHDSAGLFAFASDGDFVQHLDPFNIRLGTVRDLYRPDFPPKIDLFNPNKYVPVQTSALQSVGSAFGTWFGGRKVYTGAEMDTILGGPNRPPPKQRVTAGAPTPLKTTTRKQATAPANAGGWGLPSQTEFVQGASESARDIMARTNAALEQRGEYLQNIQDRLGSALDGAAAFAKETQKTAQQEAAKKSISAGFASLWNKIP